MIYRNKRKAARRPQMPAKTVFGTKATAAMHAPVDPDRFLAMTQVFNEGVLVPLKPRPGKGWHLTDIPINRAMMAVCGACKEANLPQGQFEAIVTRLMLTAHIVQARHMFGHYIRSSPDGLSTELGGPLLKAAAVAKIELHGEHDRFDLADVLLHAQRFESIEEAAAK
jgi:hypothetical protein